MAQCPGVRGVGPLQGPGARGAALEAISHSQVGTAAQQHACRSEPGEEEGVQGGAGPGGAADGSAVGFLEERHSCEHMQHWVAA